MEYNLADLYEAIADAVPDNVALFREYASCAVAAGLGGIKLLGAIELMPDKSDRKKRFADVGTVGGICRDLAVKNGVVMRAVRMLKRN